MFSAGPLSFCCFSFCISVEKDQFFFFFNLRLFYTASLEPRLQHFHILTSPQVNILDGEQMLMWQLFKYSTKMKNVQSVQRVKAPWAAAYSVQHNQQSECLQAQSKTFSWSLIWLWCLKSHGGKNLTLFTLNSRQSRSDATLENMHLRADGFALLYPVKHLVSWFLLCLSHFNRSRRAWKNMAELVQKKSTEKTVKHESSPLELLFYLIY